MKSLSKTPASLTLLVLIAAVFVGQQTGFVQPLYFAQINEAVLAGQWWRLLTGVFLHADIVHIAFNGYALYLLGPPLERSVGSPAFAALFLASGLSGATAYLYLGAPGSFVVGASGAIFGMFGAWLASALVQHRSPAGAAQLRTLGVLLAINLALPLFVQGIAWQGHLGGLVAGFIIFLGWVQMRRRSAGTWMRALLAVLVGIASLLPALALGGAP